MSLHCELCHLFEELGQLDGDAEWGEKRARQYEATSARMRAAAAAAREVVYEELVSGGVEGLAKRVLGRLGDPLAERRVERVRDHWSEHTID